MGWFSDTPPTAPDSSTYSMLPPDIDDWTCSQWQLYYDNLSSKYGAIKAKSFWETDAQRVNTLTSTLTNSCRNNCDFIRWTEAKGLSYERGLIMSYVWCGTKQILTSSEKIVTDVSKGAETTSSVLRWGLPVLLIGGTILAAVIYSPKPIKRPR